ncbi:YqfQ protein [Bacillus timonensis]|uniref:YqfQ protein n=1 Tax=Bacillus timonensis TaxID=1033734 RepID=UPI000289AEF1|nr:YqfQ protein [Bacillus timonensis]
MFFPRQPMNQMRPQSMYPQQFGFRPPGMYGGMQGRAGLGGMQGIQGRAGLGGMQGMQGRAGLGGMQGMQGRAGLGGMQGKSGLGGLLKRLIPGMGQSNPMQGMGGMPGIFNPSQGVNTSTLQNLANPSNLSSMLGNVQKTLKMAESVVPMVQQYGPLMKNIPSMIKMYSAIKNAGNEENTGNAEEEENGTISLSDVTSDGEELKNEEEQQKAKGSGKSVPKLYI